MLLFLNVCKQTFHISCVRISQKVKGFFNVKSATYYFHIKTKILADFQTCIIVPLTPKNSPKIDPPLPLPPPSLCITASGNILASGNSTLKLFMAPLETIELLTTKYHFVAMSITLRNYRRFPTFCLE